VPRVGESISEVVCPRPARGAGARSAVAVAAAVVIHGVVGAGIGSVPRPDEAPAARAEPQPIRMFEIEAPPPAPARPPPPTSPEPRPRATAPKPAVVGRPAQPAAQQAPLAVAPSRTAQAIAASPEVLDFTDFDIVSGDGDRFVGGVSSSDGTNTIASRGENVAKGGAVGSSEGSGASLARGVRLPDGDWSCPWPDDARAIHDWEREVRVRAVVRVDGSVASVELLSDPGHGFGEAALRCARAARFSPALDAAGHPVESRSPPIRVRFVR